VQALGRRAGCRAELLAQTATQVVVDEQRLGAVAPSVERLHQQPMSALAVRGASQQGACGSLGRVQLATTDPQRRLAGELEGSQVKLLELSAPLLDPWQVLSRQEPARCDVLRDTRWAPGAGPVAACDRCLGPVECFCCRLEVDPHVPRERQSHLAPSFQRQDAPELREQRAEDVAGRPVEPERVGQLVPRHGPRPVCEQVHEGEPPLATRELVLDPTARHARDQPSAELDPGLRQGFAKVTATAVPDNRRMAKLLINLTHGPEAPTRAALGFLVGRAALEDGHEVALFLAGDAVQLLREQTLDTLVGLGTGSLRASYDAIVERGGTFYVSGMSSKARGFEPNGEAESALPSRLVQLAFEADRVLTY